MAIFVGLILTFVDEELFSLQYILILMSLSNTFNIFLLKCNVMRSLQEHVSILICGDFNINVKKMERSAPTWSLS